MEVAIVPQSKILSFIGQGWKMVPGYSPPYRGWAVLMWRALGKIGEPKHA